MQSKSWTILLTLNILWFGMGAFHFSLRSESAARMLVLREHRRSPLFHTLSGSIRFLGGLNLAFMLLCVLLLLFASLFPERAQLALFATVLAVAHASQFAVNIPVIGKWHRNESGAWPVLKGPMLFIFSTDCLLMVANGVFAAWNAG